MDPFASFIAVAMPFIPPSMAIAFSVFFTGPGNTTHSDVAAGTAISTSTVGIQDVVTMP